MKHQYSLEEKIAYLLRIVSSCESVAQLDSALNLYTFVVKRHKSEEQKLDVVSDAIVDHYKTIRSV